jgi:hypothetical protein
MFNLGPLDRLDQRVGLDVRDLRKLGDDIRMVARITSGCGN